MSSYLPRSLEKVIEEFEKLPGVGHKSAARMAYHYIRSPYNDALVLAEALKEMEEKIVYCEHCYNVSENSVCDICSSSLRDKKMLCIVEEPLDVVAFEKSAIYNGLYFVIGGVISPADGIGPEELRFQELKQRIRKLLVDSNGEGAEVVISTNPSLEGEATATYLSEAIKEIDKEGSIVISRIATGLPTGADLEYADRTTLKRALEGRRGL